MCSIRVFEPDDWFEESFPLPVDVEIELKWGVVWIDQHLQFWLFVAFGGRLDRLPFTFRRHSGS